MSIVPRVATRGAQGGTATAGTVPVGTVVEFDAVPGAPQTRPNDEKIKIRPPGADEWRTVGTVGDARGSWEPRVRLNRPGTYEVTVKSGDIGDIRVAAHGGGLTADQQTTTATTITSTDTTTTSPTSDGGGDGSDVVDRARTGAIAGVLAVVAIVAYLLTEGS